MAGPMPAYRHRPTAVLVMAILNFIWGGLSIICFSCIAAGFLMLNSMLKSLPTSAGGGGTLQVVPYSDVIPGYLAYMIAHTIIGVVMAILLIVAGIGLLNMQPWARWCCLVYSTYHVLETIFSLFYTITVVNPGLRKWQADLMRQMGGVGPTPSSGVGDSIGAVAGAVLRMAYAVALLMVMLLPHVSAAFAGKGDPDKGYLPPDYLPDRPDSGPGDPSGGNAFRSGDPRWR
jgi:hypothetical protein